MVSKLASKIQLYYGWFLLSKECSFDWYQIC